jgi:hypothetical protein
MLASSFLTSEATIFVANRHNFSQQPSHGTLAAGIS